MNKMETIERIAIEYTLAFGETNDVSKLSKANCYELGIRQGVKIAQTYTSIKEGKPEYYKSVLGIFIIEGTEWPLSVWRAWSEKFGDIYTISGTNIIADGEPIKWRPTELK